MSNAARAPRGAAARAGAVLAALALLSPAVALAATAGGGAEAPAYQHTLTREGIAVELTIDPVADPGKTLTEDDHVTVRFRVTDTNTGEPMPSLYPAGWMDRLGEGVETDDEQCRTKVSSFVGGTFLSRAELDLNVYYVLALNEGPSISVVDPLFGFGGSKLLTTVELPGRGDDWALSADQQRLFVTIPDNGEVAVVETSIWEVVTRIPVGPGARRVVPQPDGAYLWVGYDGVAAPGEPRRSGVAVVSMTAMKVLADIPTGAGEHDIAFSDDSRWAFVSNRDAGSVSVIDVTELTEVAEVATGPSPISVAYSAIGQAAYVTDRDAGTVVVLDGDSHQVTARMQAEPGLGALRFAPGDRWGFVPRPAGNTVHIVDAALNRVVQVAEVEPGPTAVGFSDELAYILHSRSETVLMVPLGEIGREGEPVAVIDFPGGTSPAGDNPVPSPAASIVQAPGAPAVLVANPLDRAIYFYKEGMAAPMGHFSNYGRMPRAVRVVDRSLREVEPGVYETKVRLRRPGDYDLAFFLDSPRIVHCFDLAVATDPQREAERQRRAASVLPVTRPRPLTVGQEVELAFRLADPLSEEPRVGLTDVRILTLLAPGVWHHRHPAEDAGDGIYRIRFTPHRPGAYYVFVEAPSVGVELNQNPFLVLQAHEAEVEAEVAAPGDGDAGR